MVKPWLLDKLIEANRIKAFCGKAGWAVIGIDKIRKRDESNYQGHERRKKESFNPLALLYLYLVLFYQAAAKAKENYYFYILFQSHQFIKAMYFLSVLAMERFDSTKNHEPASL